MKTDTRDPSPREIRDELRRLLTDSKLATSKRLGRFLHFVVEESLAGRSDEISQRSIGVRALGYEPTFEPRNNPTIRIQAGRLRRTLDAYYEVEGRSNPVRIQIPRGGYAPLFLWADDQAAIGAPRVPAKARPSVAVLPLEYLGDDPTLSFLSDGVAEEITVALTRFEGLAVIGRQSTLRYGASDAPIERIGRELGARFLVTGTIQKRPDSLAVSAQLASARDSKIVWAERFESEISASALHEVQIELASRVASAIGDEHGIILRRVVTETRGRPPETLDAYEASMRYHHYNTVISEETHRKATAVLKHAVEQDPEYALGVAQLAFMYGDAYSLDLPGPSDALGRAEECAHRAVRLDPQCQEARAAMAYVHFLNRQHGEAIREAEAAIRLNPNSAYHVGYSGWLMGLCGAVDRGCRIIDDTEALNPYRPGWMRLVPLLKSVDDGEHAQAYREARRFGLPELPWDSMLRAWTADLAGNATAARTAWEEFSVNHPEVAADPEPIIRKHFHFERWVESLLATLGSLGAVAGRA